MPLPLLPRGAVALLSKWDFDVTHDVALTFVLLPGGIFGSSMMSPLGQRSSSNAGTPRTPRNLAMVTNPRQLNYDLTVDKPCVSARASFDRGYSRKKPERNDDKLVPADKPCVSSPGESITAWRRDPKIYLEYSNQYAEKQRPGFGERLKTAADRDALPYCRAKNEKKEDGAYAKPLVGYRNYQGRQSTSARETIGRIPTGLSAGAIRQRELRSSYKEFRVSTLYLSPILSSFLVHISALLPCERQSFHTNPLSPNH